MSKPSDGGKGSVPRKVLDDKTFSDNWDLIFRKKKEPNESLSKIMSEQDPAFTKPSPERYRYEKSDFEILDKSTIVGPTVEEIYSKIVEVYGENVANIDREPLRFYAQATNSNYLLRNKL
jgi:hypothetical protein